MLDLLGQDLFTFKFNDEFVGVISTKSVDYLALLIYNYIDPQAAMNYISHNLVHLNSAEQKAILGIVKSDRMKKILAGQLSLATLRLSVKTKTLLSRAIELNSAVNKFSTTNRKIKISLKGLKDTYHLSKYIINSNCSRNCEFKPSFEKDVDFNQDYVEATELSPYSVQLLVFKKKPVPPEALASGSQTTALPAEEKPAEAKPAEVKPAETKPAVALPAEVKPEEKPAEAKTAAPVALASGSQTTALPAEEKPAPKETNSAETK